MSGSAATDALVVIDLDAESSQPDDLVETGRADVEVQATSKSKKAGPACVVCQQVMSRSPVACPNCQAAYHVSCLSSAISQPPLNQQPSPCELYDKYHFFN
eukprot:m.102416 g.102416  ORF g.102416 m.102416 type:complete len:101 (+) comp13220_c0_seq2:220-522(+)